MEIDNDIGIREEASPGMVLDAAAKMMFQDLDMVANLVNARIYGGMAVVRPEMLTPRPVELNALMRRKGAIATDNRFRDLAFFVDTGDGHGFVLCIEIQGTPDWKMPVRVHEYNIREYSRLAKESRYSRRRKLPLVVTLVLNFGKSAWNGARSFVDLADYRDDDVVQLAEQGNIVLIDPYNLDSNFLSHLCTDWKVVLCSFPASKKQGSLNEFAREINGIHLRRSTLDFLKVYFNMDLEIVNEDEKGGHVNMCRAVTQIRQSGIRTGIRTGIKTGIKIGIEQGREEGISDVVVNALRKNMAMEEIQELTGFSLEKIASIAQSLETVKA